MKSGEKTFVRRPRQEQLLKMLRDRKTMTPREIRTALGITRQGALKLLNPLLAGGMIVRIGKRKASRYVYSPTTRKPKASSGKGKRVARR